MVGGWVPRDRDQPESMDVQRSWLFGLRGTLTSTHPRILGRAEVGLTAIPRSKPSLGLAVRAASTPLCQLARMARRPGGQSALAQALWCQLGLERGAGKEGSGEPGAAMPAQPRGCPLPELYQGRLGGASRRLGLTGTGLPAAEV